MYSGQIRVNMLNQFGHCGRESTELEVALRCMLVHIHSYRSSVARNGIRREGEQRECRSGKEEYKNEKRETSRSPRLGVDVKHVTLLHIELEQTARNLRDIVLELEIGDVLVVGQMEVLPGLCLLDLLTPNGLRDLLLFLDRVDNITIPICVAFSMFAAGVDKDVVDGLDALRWAIDDCVLCLLQTTDAGLAL